MPTFSGNVTETKQLWTPRRQIPQRKPCRQGRERKSNSSRFPGLQLLSVETYGRWVYRNAMLHSPELEIVVFGFSMVPQASQTPCRVSTETVHYSLDILSEAQ
ncbi:hypothetical protein HBI82_143000 [Parastagonospora nodorum]|nr:hypothetical protein HBI79_117690 [Parastagonospora nodorum]KAH5658252.1 hypothetical protein HBI23_134000 [Parastagonospora nodorum]KAH6007238.1 hypothetical protein HBI82_143000 [Parastagonospora nodorum]